MERNLFQVFLLTFYGYYVYMSILLFIIEYSLHNIAILSFFKIMKIEIEVRDIPFFRLSTQHDLILFLIKKELQGTKLTLELDRIGFDHSLYAPDLGDVILSLAGFEKRGDELWTWYYGLMQAHAEKVDLNEPETAHDQALEMYFALREKL